MPASGLITQEAGTGLLWSSRRWTAQPSGNGSPEQPLFSVRGRSALDVYARPTLDQGNETHAVRAYGVVGEVRTLLGESWLRSHKRGPILSVRNICTPEVHVVVEPYAPGFSPVPWLFGLTAWGREPSGSAPLVAWDSSNNSGGAESRQIMQISDVPCSLHWLEVLQTTNGYPNCWAQLHDVSGLVGEPEFTSETLRAQWRVWYEAPLLQVKPPQPLTFRRGCWLVASGAPDVYTPLAVQLWSHWQTSPTLAQPWDLIPVMAGTIGSHH